MYSRAPLFLILSKVVKIQAQTIAKSPKNEHNPGLPSVIFLETNISKDNIK